jgi:hypothetical protein
MRQRTVWLGPLVSLAVLLTSCGHPGEPASAGHASAQRPDGPIKQLSQPEGGQTASRVPPDQRVGALFFGGASIHSCTGAVLHSRGGDLMLTAAHCLSGGSPATFEPGFAGGAAPANQWAVRDLYFDPRWLSRRDPRADYVIARVSGSGEGSLESRAGASLTLGTAPVAGSRIKVIGYPAGVGGSPIGCQARTGLTETGFPSLGCAGFVDGTSGAPWVSGSSVIGLIGGLEGGGCAENMSYSAPFDERTAALLARAEAGGPGDTAPTDYEDPC